VDGRKLRVSEYKQLMKARRHDVRHLWYNCSATGGGSTSSCGGQTAAISVSSPAMMPSKPGVDDPQRRGFFDNSRSGITDVESDQFFFAEQKQICDCKIKQASHWHEFCSRNAPQYGVPSRAVLVTRILSRRQGDAQLAPCRAICHA